MEDGARLGEERLDHLVVALAEPGDGRSRGIAAPPREPFRPLDPAPVEGGVVLDQPGLFAVAVETRRQRGVEPGQPARRVLPELALADLEELPPLDPLDEEPVAVALQHRAEELGRPGRRLRQQRAIDRRLAPGIVEELGLCQLCFGVELGAVEPLATDANLSPPPSSTRSSSIGKLVR